MPPAMGRGGEGSDWSIKPCRQSLYTAEITHRVQLGQAVGGALPPQEVLFRRVELEPEVQSKLERQQEQQEWAEGVGQVVSHHLIQSFCVKIPGGAHALWLTHSVHLI